MTNSSERAAILARENVRSLILLEYLIYKFIKLKYKDVLLREIPSTQRRGTN